MTTMELMSVIALVSFFNISSFIIGAKIGQKVNRGESIESPRIELKNPIKTFNENKEAKKEQEKNRIIAENIDSYNGTPYGQQELPK